MTSAKSVDESGDLKHASSSELFKIVEAKETSKLLVATCWLLIAVASIQCLSGVLRVWQAVGGLVSTPLASSSYAILSVMSAVTMLVSACAILISAGEKRRQKQIEALTELLRRSQATLAE